MQKNLYKKIISRNKKARFNYTILKTFAAGISLKGHEVKSAKSGGVSLSDSYVRVFNEEVWLINTHISLWSFAHARDYDPHIRRKLLLTKKEIKELLVAQEGKRLVIIPLDMFLDRGYIKVTIATANRKKKYDKRAVIKEREMKRQIEEDLKKIKRF